MSRRRAAEKRVVIPDHKYKDITLTKFMNRIMLDGKKSTSEKIVYGAFDILSKKTEKSPIDFFTTHLTMLSQVLKLDQEELVEQLIKYRWKLDQEGHKL